MKNTLLKRILSFLIVAAMVFSIAPQMHAQEQESSIRWRETDQQISVDASDRLANIDLDDPFAPDEIVRVSIVLEEKSTLEAGFSTLDISANAQAMSYNNKLMSNQKSIERRISTQVLNGEPLDVVWNLTLVGNIISANVPYGKIAQIQKIDGVAGVVLENMYEPYKDTAENSINPNQFAATGMTGSNTVWTNGYTGAGSRIAIIDTGTDTDHQSFDNGAFLYALEQNAQAAGVTVDEYIAGLNLLDAEELANILPSLNIYERDNTLTAAQLYLNEKLAFAVNYVDEGEGRLNVTHDYDSQSNHGSHVAGISTANRFIPSGEGYVDALETVKVTGVAPDAQLITMKVFGTNTLRDSDYMAAIEDAILLGCDAVNLSLGTTVPGYAFNDYYAELLNFIAESDTVVIASAGNEGKWTDMTMFTTPYSDDVVFNTVGAPGSYANFFTVASVDNDGIVSIAFSVGDSYYAYAENTGYGNLPLTSIDTSAHGSGTVFEYIFTDGLGYESDYEGLDLTGKIVFCSRGETNFSAKANIAASLGAAAVIIYNNRPGAFGMDLSGYSYTAPCVSIPQEYSDLIREASTAQTTEAGLAYYTGKITVYASPQAAIFNSAYYTMSDFSSWGVPSDLSIKPEITAPGGFIYSVYGSTPELYGTGEYGLMSGTSMAAPQVAGMVALLAQYLRQSGLAEELAISPRVLAHSLLMSTSVPMIDGTSGSYYSILNQGAGLARVDLATLATSYIMVEGQDDGKVKAELGDDPQRTGVYEFTFTINNLTGQAQDYALDADLFRQGVYDPGEAYGTPYGFTVQETSTVALAGYARFAANGKPLVSAEDLKDFDLNGDSITDELDADYLLEYLLGNETTLHANGDINADGTVNTYDAHCLLALLADCAVVTVPANGSITVDVQLILPEASKEALNALSADGAFVQAYVFAEQITAEEGVEGTNHSIPALAFYGNWTDPNMFDRGYYVEMFYGISDLVPYLYQAIGNGNALTVDYGNGNEYYFGGNPILQDEEYIAARNAFNSQDASYLKAQYFSLIRNAGATKIEIVNKETGEVYYARGTGPFYTAYYNSSYGVWENTQQGINLFWTGDDANGDPLPEGTVVEVIMTAAPEYYRNEDGSYDFEALGHGSTLVTELTIDNTAPEISDFVLDVENGTTLKITAQDNQHIAAAVLSNKTGSIILASNTPNQTVAGAETEIELDLSNLTGSSFLLGVYDYAMNVTVYEIELDLPEIERPYFTTVDYTEGIYYGLNHNGDTVTLGVSDRGMIMAAEFVDGYVFEVSDGNKLYVASDADLYSFEYVATLDPEGQWGITNFLDLAYNYSDGKLYGMFYCNYNYEATPMICTIDMLTGHMEIVLEMPIDVNNMAIDDHGNFYSVSYGAPSLYTYTLVGARSGIVTYIGDISYYGTSSFNSLAWDHNTDMLYWAYPNTLLLVNPKTAEPTLLSYFLFSMVGLYIRPDSYDETRFAPTDNVVGVELDYYENRVLVGSNVLLSATVRPWNVSDKSVVWTSDNEAVATVDQNGMVTGVSVGVATITATSTLDPTISASCVVEVAELDKTLNALVWDTDGKIWWSEFHVNDLPNYTKLRDTPVPEYLASTAFAPDGTLYAASTDLSTGFLSSSLFTVDPETFEITKIGDSEWGYSDIAYAPHLNGGAIMGTYGDSLLVVDPSTGEQYGFYQMFMYGLSAVAYVGSDRFQDYGFDTYIDWFFLIDTQGYVYLLGFLADDAGDLYYLEHPAAPGGIFTVVNYASDVIYFSSAHYDGEFLYWSVYNEDKDVSTLFAIDTAGSRKSYNLGDFGAGVWPVGGLCELDYAAEGTNIGTDAITAAPKAANAAKSEPKQVPAAAANDVVTNPLPIDLLSVGNHEPENQQFVVEITPADIATNGTVEVTYDPARMTLLNVSGNTTAFAYNQESGTVTIAFAEAEALDTDTVAATLTFQIVAAGSNTVTIKHIELNQGTSDKIETLTVHAHMGEIVVGDVNCDGFVDTTDAKLIMQYDLGIIDTSALDLSVADVNGDGLVDTTDAKLIMQLDLGIITEFPKP